MAKPTSLSGLRILDLSRVLAGPFCTQLLGDLGADVIKIERPGIGDDTRSWGPPFLIDAAGKPTQESAFYLCANRNKRSVALEISTRSGAETVKRLLATSDVLIENFKVGSLAKYGLSYDDVKCEFPRLVYCSITGFGQTGPNSHRPGYDLLAQGYGGMMSLTGQPDGQPTKVGVGIIDIATGLYAATAILAALRHRDATGQGQQIDISLVDVQISCLVNEAANYLLSGKLPVRQGNAHPNIVPYQVFELSDGYAIIAIGSDSQFEKFCHLIGLPELSADPQFATNAARLINRGLLLPILIEKLKSLSRTWLLEEMETLSIPGGPIHTLREVFDSDQVSAREMQISMPHVLSRSGQVELVGNPIKFSETPVSYSKSPPACGEDTERTLAELLETVVTPREH